MGTIKLRKWDTVEYLKTEVDTFFVRRQQDLARERRRLVMNVMIAVGASILMGGVSLMYHRVGEGQIDMYGVFRIVLGALIAGYGAYLMFSLFRKYQRMSEHQKDILYLSMRYWGALHPESLFGQAILLFLLLAMGMLLFFPETFSRLVGSDALRQWLGVAQGAK